jgi:dTDP-4-dehydrorhamnose 3,5-epimerase
VGQRRRALEALELVTGPPVRETGVDGVVVWTPTPIRDDRGFFSRTLDLAWCEALGLETTFVHHNQSRSTRGVLRGLHVRIGAGEAKLVRCARGRVIDHVVDTRPWSRTFRRTEQVVLDDELLHHLYLPPFVAHGFQVVSEVADVCYLHSRPYEAGEDLSIAWDDPTLALAWPILPPILAERDATAPPLAAVDLEGAFERG